MTHAPNYTPLLLPVQDAARYIGVSASTLRGLGIARRILGAKRLYDQRDLDAFVNALPYEHDKPSEENTCDAAFGLAHG